MFDVCVVGHLTKDIIRVDGRVEKELPGGTAYYSSIALNSLGLNVAVITKTARNHRDVLLEELEARGITVFWQESRETSLFEDIYQRDNLDCRVEKVWAVADPFSPQDLGEVSAKLFHLGPLTNGDMTPEFWSAMAANPGLVSLDAQGLIRQITPNAEVCNLDWADKRTGLRSIEILKVDDKEAKVLSGKEEVEQAAMQLQRWGPQEVIVTLGSGGSLVCTPDRLYQIPAFAPKAAIDATGCGDTYIAGYLYQRLQGGNFEQAGRFGAMAATRKLEKFGPLSESLEY